MSLLSFLTKTELPKEHDALVGREEKIFDPSSHFVNKNIYPINSSIFEKVYLIIFNNFQIYIIFK